MRATRRGAAAPALTLAVTTVLTLALSGCGGGNIPEQLPPTDDPVVWAGRLCAALTPLTGLRNQKPDFNPNDPAASRESLTRFFDDTQARIGESTAGLGQLGPSPIPGGDDAAAKVRAELDRLGTTFGTARNQVEAVDPTDPIELGAKLPDILNGLSAASTDPALRALTGNQALADAVRQSPSCSLIQPS